MYCTKFTDLFSLATVHTLYLEANGKRGDCPHLEPYLKVKGGTTVTRLHQEPQSKAAVNTAAKEHCHTQPLVPTSGLGLTPAKYQEKNTAEKMSTHESKLDESISDPFSGLWWRP